MNQKLNGHQTKPNFLFISTTAIINSYLADDNILHVIFNNCERYDVLEIKTSKHLLLDMCSKLLRARACPRAHTHWNVCLSFSGYQYTRKDTDFVGFQTVFLGCKYLKWTLANLTKQKFVGRDGITCRISGRLKEQAWKRT